MLDPANPRALGTLQSGMVLGTSISGQTVVFYVGGWAAGAVYRVQVKAQVNGNANQYVYGEGIFFTRS